MADSVTQPPLRVLHVIESLGRGGAEQLLVTLLPELRAHNIEPLVAVLRAPLDLQAKLEDAGITVMRLHRFARWNLWAGRRALAEACRAADVDVLHAHLYFPSLYAGLLAMRDRRPLFETFHNLAYGGANRGGWKLALRRHLRGFVARRSGARFLGVSEAVADHYAQALSLAHVATLPNSVDLAEIERAREAAAQTRERNAPLTLVVPGRLVTEKGHADLLDALKTAELPPYRLHFLGGGPLHETLEAQARMLNIPLETSGVIPHDRFLAELAQADICIVPSRHEGFGIAAAEAMALGIPTITSNAGGLQEVVGDAGLVVPAGDINGLVEAIALLAADPEKRRILAERARARIAAHFSVEASATRLAAMYRDAAGNSLQTR